MRNQRRSLWLLTTALISLGAAGVAQAQEQTYQFDIPAESLNQALTDFSQVSSKSVIASPDVVNGRTTKGLHGRYTAQQALDTLLVGTGLHFETNASGVMMVRSKNVQAASNEAANNGPRNEIETVTVTGTRLHGVNPETSPLTTYSRTDIDRSGAATTGDFMRTVPQNLSAVAPTANLASGFSSTQVTENAFNGNGVDLLGLGEGSTLVLLNGHRLAPAGSTGSFVDISSIPLDVVDRVEMLTDGASAIYGADAVGGVVNFVLRKDFDGAETRLRYGDSTDGGGMQETASQLLGKSWDGGNAMISYEFQHQDALDASQRGFVPPLAFKPFNLLPDTQTQSVFGNVQQDIVPGLTVSADALYSDRTFGSTSASPTGLYVSSARGDVKTYDLNGAATANLGGSWIAVLSGQYAENDQNVALDNGVFGRSGIITNTNIASIDLTSDGILASLPGGDIHAAIGVSDREEKFKDSIGFGKGSRNVFSAFGELLVPIIGDANASGFAKRLDLSLAGRLDDYNDTGTTFNPKVGVLWSPVSWLDLRTSYGTSYQAPSLSELYGQQESFVFNLPNSASMTGFTPTIIDASVGNLALKPETSRSFTTGFVARPDWFPGFQLSATYFNVNFKGKISKPPAPGGLFAIFSQPGLAPFIDQSPTASQVSAYYSSPGFSNPSGIPAGSVKAIFDNRYLNLASDKEEGFELTGSYDLDSDVGHFSINSTAVYIDHIDLQATPFLQPIDIAGTTFNPVKFRLNSALTWSNHNWAATATLRYTGPYTNTLVTPNKPIDAWTTLDVQVGYHTDPGDSLFLSNLSLTLTVQNVFDTDPPFVATPTTTIPLNFDPANATPLGRFISVQLTKAF